MPSLKDRTHKESAHKKSAHKKSKAPALPFLNGLSCPQLRSLPKPGVHAALSIDQTLSTKTAAVDKNLYEFSHLPAICGTLIPVSVPVVIPVAIPVGIAVGVLLAIAGAITTLILTGDVIFTPMKT
ncbi:MAG: hypothetical protein CMN41_01075 [SAR116 cluster bacterium]|nr:hypothetical protein [SAR116 cluster bacterium]RPH00497.1 MAG: hypothetical protein CBD36_001070 [Candidatus Puniceispirillum sp. TMED176]|tara:strand:+ start:2436 stop:2813 length:378 start_codon:yes stop_codon:yes gene_type:complete